MFRGSTSGGLPILQSVSRKPHKPGNGVQYVIGVTCVIAVIFIIYNTHTLSTHAKAATSAQQPPQQAGKQTATAQQLDLLEQADSQKPTKQAKVDGYPEVWAAGPQKGPQQDALLKLLDDKTLSDIKSLCGRCLYRTLTSYVRVHDFGRFTVVLTGDIPAMWLRDSAVQMASYFPRVSRRPAIRQVLEGAIRAQSYFILQDPWANAYNPHYVPISKLKKQDRQLGRGGWVWTRNFELDSVAYFFNFIWNFHQTPAIWQPEQLLFEPLVHDAVVAMLKLLEVEQHHEKQSPYRYSELAQDGLGPPCGYTGMVWSAFRASDDPQKYSYNLPDNMYLWGSLNRLAKLNAAVWRDSYIANTSQRLMADIHKGIQEHGIVEEEVTKVKMYAYEVDGLGNELIDFDDPNLPSLLALPLLGYDLYDKDVYLATKKRILSKANAYYFEGNELHGLGSPHTNSQFVWPLATAVEGLTSDSPQEQVEKLKMLLKMAYGNGLLHESVHVSNVAQYTRAEFGWANAMFVVAVESLLGIDCDEEAEKHRLQEIVNREAREVKRATNGGNDIPQYYEQLEAGIIHHLQFDE